MVESLFLPPLAALWSGILTSLSPCPLATNITALAFIGNQAGRKRLALFSGISYSLGRMTAYVIVSAALSAGLASLPVLSHFLQSGINQILGPLLILVGMVLLELIRPNFSGGLSQEWIVKRNRNFGVPGSFGLGFLFALAFCPVSATLFFGTLIPLSISQSSPVLLPALYGLGTALPVAIFAVLLAGGFNTATRIQDRISLLERRLRKATGFIFIGTGIYFSLVHIFRLQLF